MKKTPLNLLLTALLSAGAILSFSSCEEEKDEVTILSAVAGGYIGQENCGGAVGDYTITVYNTTDEANKVWINHIYGIAPAMKATVEGNKITLPATPFNFKSGNTTYNLTAAGTGTVTGDSLVLDFQIGGDFEDACKFRGNRAVVLKPAGSTP